MKIKENGKILCIGDSVTDCGRRLPVGEGNDSLGNGYVQYLHALIDSQHPEEHIRVINMGIGGNTSRDVKSRYGKDALDLNPDYVILMIGINDIWRRMISVNDRENQISLEEYGNTIQWICRETVNKVEGMFLLSPIFMNTNPNDEMRIWVEKYQQELKRIAGEYDNVEYLDVQKNFDRYFQYYHYSAMASDAVHPNHVGHMMIANEIYSNLEFAGNRNY